MGNITLTSIGPSRFRVEVHQPDGSKTSHVVTVPNGFLESAGITAPLDQVVRESFAFLLEREPASAILREFELPVIGQYFDAYLDDLRRRLG